MARQTGIIPITGKLGDLVFYRTRTGNFVRRKSNITKEKLNSDPAYQKLREHMAEFAKAGKAAKFFRDAIWPLVENTGDSRLISRLIKQLVYVVKADLLNPRGMRNVMDGELELLQGFEFNPNRRLTSRLYAPFTTAIDRLKGLITVDIPQFIPERKICPPPGATHYRISAISTEIDFGTGIHSVTTSSTAELPLDLTPTAPIALVNKVTANRKMPLLLVLMIEFFNRGYLMPGKMVTVASVVKAVRGE